jgi:hypothetical protein
MPASSAAERVAQPVKEAAFARAQCEFSESGQRNYFLRI